MLRPTMSEAAQATLWGMLSGGALVLGAALAFMFPVRQRVVANIMAFGAGVLMSALSFELMAVAFEQAGIGATALGFVGGAVVYSSANLMLAQYGAKHRKRSGDHQSSEADAGGGGTAIAVGALLDGIPESYEQPMGAPVPRIRSRASVGRRRDIVLRRERFERRGVRSGTPLRETVD
jgi:ZIP family zinc transporter